MAPVLVFAGAVFPQARTRELVRRDNVTIEVIAEGRGPLIVMLPSRPIHRSRNRAPEASEDRVLRARQ
jgi:hypothetical protein